MPGFVSLRSLAGITATRPGHRGPEAVRGQLQRSPADVPWGASRQRRRTQIQGGILVHGTRGRGRYSGRRLVQLTVLSVALGLVIASSASAATRYMAPGGSGSLCSLASPCGSMNSAYQGAMLGDTIVMAAGNYG